MSLSSIFESLGLGGKMSLDIMLLIAVIIVTVLFVLIFGRSKLASIFSGIYIAIALTSVATFGIFENYLYRLGLFFLIIIVMAFWERKFLNSTFSNVGYGFTWKVFLMSFLEVMLILSYIITIVPHKVALGFVSDNAFEYIATGYFRLGWMILPFLFLSFANRKTGRY